MSMPIDRRGALLGAAALLFARSGRAAEQPGSGKLAGADSVAADRVAEIETREGGRLGVAILDTATGKKLQYRASERFALCSTFKFLAAAAILRQVDLGKERLDRWVAYGESDLQEYAPVSRQHVEEHGMVLADVCAAAVEMSDNTAANLLLRILGGPARLTQYIRSLGDNITRLDRNEPSLNVVRPGEVRDTTTPESMLNLLNIVILGHVLSDDSRSRLEAWMRSGKVGQRRIPAGLPDGWRIAHKTGTGSDETNDVGVVWPPNRAPILVAAFYARGGTRPEQREAVLRDVGRVLAAAF